MPSTVRVPYATVAGRDMIRPSHGAQRAHMDEAEAGTRIKEIVRRCWEDEGTPILLSALGSREGRGIADAAKLVSGGLRAFIEQHLKEDVLVIQHRRRPTIVGAVPRDAEDEERDWDALLDGIAGNSALTTRYHRAFWGAFRHPIANSHSRYLTVSGPVRYVDEPHGSAPDQMVELPRDLIDPAATDSDVHRNISAWLDQSGTSVARFLDRGDSSSLPNNDVLGKLIQSLEQDELEQISIPMPIIAKLRRKPA